ncbi:MAG TPA: hypothetical protein P5120_01740 [Spirochaetota bacterium]|nr:hypothetical protein [Spirochaetota bacterium]
MRYIVIIYLCIISLLLSCSSPGKWGYRAAERADVDIVGNRAGLIRTVYCDIYIEEPGIEQHRKIYESDVYRGSGSGMPLEPCFQFIVSNTWNRPLIIEKITIRYDNEDHGPEFYDYIKDPDYTEKRFAVNLNKMMQYRRLLTEDELIDEIDYDTETVEYRSDFIAPGDKVLLYRFFPVIPHNKGVKIYISIKYFNMKKIIDFDITRFDYTDE